MRGRSSRTKGPNPLSRAYESNGPDVKVRGTAQHIADKYAQLARDATVSGDPVAAENYLQHAEHYYRIIAAAQEQYRQQFGTQHDDEEGDEEVGPGGYPFGGQAAVDEYGEGASFDPRFSGNDRPQQLPPPPQQRFDRGSGQQYGQGQNGQGQNRRDGRSDRPNGERYERGPGNDRGGGERGERFDRNANGPSTGQFDRGDRNDRSDRGEGGSERRERYGRGEQARGEQARGEQARGEQARGEQARGENVRVDNSRGENSRSDNGRGDGPRGENGRESGGRQDGGRQEGGRREFNRERSQGGPRSETASFAAQDDGGEAATGLPAFLTKPVRAPASVADEGRDDPPAASVGYGDAPLLEVEPAAAVTEARPRRRRVRRPDSAADTLPLGPSDVPGEADKTLD